MTRNPVRCCERQQDQLPTALQEMRRIGVRRMPVASASWVNCWACCPIDDVLDVLPAELGNLAGAIRNERRNEKALRT